MCWLFIKCRKKEKDQAAYASLFSLHVVYNFREAVELNKNVYKH